MLDHGTWNLQPGPRSLRQQILRECEKRSPEQSKFTFQHLGHLQHPGKLFHNIEIAHFRTIAKPGAIVPEYGTYVSQHLEDRRNLENQHLEPGKNEKIWKLLQNPGTQNACCSCQDAESVPIYGKHGFQHLEPGKNCRMPAKASQNMENTPFQHLELGKIPEFRSKPRNSV